MAVHMGIMDFGAQGLYIVYFFGGITKLALIFLVALSLVSKSLVVALSEIAQV